MIEGDSDEYWFLTEAVEMSKDVDGMCCEIGLRLGMGTKTIIDAVRVHCPNKLVVSVDPYGNMPYIGREHIGLTHYDYTDIMRNECMVDMWTYVRDNPVDWRFIQLADFNFFNIYSIGIPYYDYDGGGLYMKYSMVHLDGPHSVLILDEQIRWFNARMNSGAVICVDDVTPDFIDIRPINDLFEQLGWELVKEGNKKNIYQKR